MRKLLILVIAMIPFILNAQLTARSLTAANGKKVGYYQFLPNNYGKTTSLHPLIISLHGISERGNGTTELTRVLNVGLPRYAKNGRTFVFNFAGKTEGFVLLAPQLGSEFGDWQTFYIDEMINYAVKNLKVDPNRIILSGLSLGGGGTWKYASSSSTAASKLAGLVPVCGTCQMSNANNIASNNIGVYAFHSKADTRVSYNCSNNAVNAINAANPKIKAILQSYITQGHVIWDMAYDTAYSWQNPNVFEWMLGQNKALAPNKIPSANAGSDVTISTSNGKVTLTGSGSDADGSIVRYAWKKISGPSYGSIATPQAASTSISGLTVSGTYVYQLTTVDNRGSWNTDQVTVNVTSGTVNTTNKVPVANAGADKTISLPTTTATLTGTGTDSDGTIASYSWSKVSGPTGGIISAVTSASTSISGMSTAGTYVFRLTVKDNAGASDYDDVSIIVNNAIVTNKVPVVNAGADKTITLPTSSIALSGSATDDGSIVSYGWTSVSGPASVTFSNASSATPTVSGLTTAGTYVLRLSAKDNGGAVGFDDINIIVKSSTTTTANQAPVARAGNDITISGSTFTLDGTASSDDKGIAYKTWSQLAGPSSSSISDYRSLKTSVNNLVPGVYRFRVRVWDAEGVIDTDDIYVTVSSSTTGSSGGSSTTSDNTSTSNAESVVVSPNPVIGKTMYLKANSNTNGQTYISVYTLGGTLLKRFSYNKTTTSFNYSMDISNLSKGTYIAEVLTGSKRLTTQFGRQ